MTTTIENAMKKQAVKKKSVRKKAVKKKAAVKQTMATVDKNTTQIATILDKEKAIAAFTGDVMDATLERIKTDAMSIVADINTKNGRDEIRSTAAGVAKKKVILENARKELTAEWASKKKLVDASGKHAREFLDDVRDKVRQPLTLWEEEQKRKSELAAIAAELAADHDEALSMNDLFDREAIVKQKELAAALRETEEKKKKEIERIAAENLENERILKEQAAEKARADAAKESQSEIDNANRLKAEATADAERIKREALEAANKAERDAEQAKTDKAQALIDAQRAQEQAVRDAQESVRFENEQAEITRQNEEAETQRQEDIRASDVAHQAQINNDIMQDFMKQLGFDQKTSRKIVVKIFNKRIRHLTINY